MTFTTHASLFAGALFVGMLLVLEAGRRLGARPSAQDIAGARAGLGAVEAAVFALLGLLIAFTFSGAASRFDTRRQLVVTEANAIGTAWLRLDLLPASAQPALRELFRRYLDSRLETYRKLPDVAAAKAELAHSVSLQNEIWKQAVTASRDSGSQAATMLVLPALNAMIDITTTRVMATQMHPPKIIFAMLALLSLTGALLAGYGMAGGKTRSWIHIAGFAAIMAVTFYVILDVEYPRRGLIRVNAVDQVLRDLRQSMEQPGAKTPAENLASP
ncbi:MAG: hypothetical protein JWR69_1204 [Pedosphaera sp.]|nr:hypothetical protein [Pedosphaera sp.]